MTTYAMMSGNTVSNIIVADDKEGTEQVLGCVLIEFTADNPAGIGYMYDPETGKFNPPPVNIETDEEKKQALLNRLGITQEEFDLLNRN